MTTMGDRVRSKRDEMGLSQEALARELECSVKTVSRYETGEQLPRRGKRLSALAKVLGVTEEWLEYGRSPSSEPVAEPVQTRELGIVDQAIAMLAARQPGGRFPPALEQHLQQHATTVVFSTTDPLSALFRELETEIRVYERVQDGMPPKVKEAPATEVKVREGAMPLNRKPKGKR